MAFHRRAFFHLFKNVRLRVWVCLDITFWNFFKWLNSLVTNRVHGNNQITLRHIPSVTRDPERCWTQPGLQPLLHLTSAGAIPEHHQRHGRCQQHLHVGTQTFRPGVDGPQAGARPVIPAGEARRHTAPAARFPDARDRPATMPAVPACRDRRPASRPRPKR